MKRLTLIALIVAFAPAVFAAPPAPRPAPPKLAVVQHQGQAFYKTYRVTSTQGLCRIQKKADTFRFFQGGGQYGEAFYLFTKLDDARTFAKCEKTRGAAHRNVIAEVLLPKKMLDEVKKATVDKPLDWGMNKPRTDASYNKLRDLRLSNHLLFGKWADSPDAKEPFYKPMNGREQIGVVQRGMPSILHQALIREIERAQ